ncbi:hypothetical protein EDC96DRAFT_561740 [Choanephora cucurbitarum]|nr:hypothetical protein EDC96DRAFT_561740 [Choanephora cucurbitarum]
MKFSKKSGKSLMNSCQKTKENVVIIRDSMNRWEHNFASFQQVVGRCNITLSKFASTQYNVVTQLQSSIDNRPVLWNERISQPTGPVLGDDSNKYYQKRIEIFLQQWLGDQVVIGLREETAVILEIEARIARYQQTIEMHGKAAVNYMIDQAIKDGCKWKEWTYTEVPYDRRLTTLETIAYFGGWATKKSKKSKGSKRSNINHQEVQSQRDDTSRSLSVFEHEAVSSREPGWASKLLSERQENPLGSDSDSQSPKRRRITESL